MAYTVKKISELSGVTVRTLHFYEEVDLLKPAYYGSNGYRYYEEKELLRLQQILFFKELGFSLKQILKVLGRSDFDQLTALYSHKKSLHQEREKIEKLLETIDQTINHLQGKKKMEDKDMFYGFTQITVGKGTEAYFAAEEMVLKSIIPSTSCKTQKQAIKTGYALYREMAQCMEKGLFPDSELMQQLVRKHHTVTKQYHEATKEVYKALAELYLEHPAFRAQLDQVHPDLAPFLSRAMCVFADLELN